MAAKLRVLSTHLGLRPAERRKQVRRILSALDADAQSPVILMGDVNEWYLWGRPVRWLRAHFRACAGARDLSRPAAGLRVGPHLGASGAMPA